MSALTYDQETRKLRRSTLHYIRQAQMRPEDRPRQSPRKTAPRTKDTQPWMISQRICAEHVKDHPNDYRYLFRDTRSRTPLLVWLNSAGMRMSPLFESVFAACAFLSKDGWEDTSW